MVKHHAEPQSRKVKVSNPCDRDKAHRESRGDLGKGAEPVRQTLRLIRSGNDLRVGLSGINPLRLCVINIFTRQK